MTSPHPRAAVAAALLAAALLLLTVAPAPAAEPPELWPADQREFLLDGPAWLLPEAERAALAEMPEAERAAFIEEFLSAGPMPGVTPAELAEAIRRRRALVRSAFLSPADVRARLLFLHGAPAERLIIDCAATFQPLELWAWATGDATDPEAREEILVFRPGPSRPWKVWTPVDGKRPLYTGEMEYYLEQWEANDGRLWTAERFDLQSCPETPRVDRVTRIRALHVYLKGRPTAAEFLSWLEPPGDLARWVKEAAETPLHDGPPPLDTSPVEVLFPGTAGQRLIARFQLRVPQAWELPTAPSSAFEEEEEVRLVVEGVVEEGGRGFEDLRVRFVLPPPPEGKPLVLVFEEPLRPRQEYLIRLRVRDEISGRSAYLVQGFRVPDRPQEVALPPPPEEAIVSIGRALARQEITGEDSLLLVPPAA
ncbi:MAG TPA: hypothetical protein VLF66_01130, partial [Thermoanaerobaculia bacterium]|nr:hypothetical protein [Thermoanaerobaculia bacterium]